MSIKEWIIKSISLKINQPEKIINIVITNEFDQANDALATNDQVEISGFGKYIFNRKKAIKRMASYLERKEEIEMRLKQNTLPLKTRKNLEVKLEILEVSIKMLKPKLNENK